MFCETNVEPLGVILGVTCRTEESFPSRCINLLSNTSENSDRDEPTEFQAVTFAVASRSTQLSPTVTGLSGEGALLCGGNPCDVELWID